MIKVVHIKSRRAGNFYHFISSMFADSLIHETIVVLGTYNRGHLLRRSLKLYEKQDVALIVIDDDSSDDTFYVCESSSCAIYFIKLPPKGQQWRDSSSFLNLGIATAINRFDAKWVFITHPEIIPGIDTIECCKQSALGYNTWVNAKGYYLKPEHQKMIDTVNWQSNPLNVRDLPGFYSSPSAEFENRDYTPEAIDRTAVWASWIFGGGSSEMWQFFGGVTEFEIWGSVDVDLLNRRARLGMQTVTPMVASAMVIHQNHDDPAENIVTPRDMEKCMAALPDYNIADPRKPHLLSRERWQQMMCNK